MVKQDYHVVPHGQDWAVQKEGAQPSSIHGKKEEALQAGRSLAQKDHVELVIHGKDGRVQDSDSYGNDPPRRKDTRH